MFTGLDIQTQSGTSLRLSRLNYFSNKDILSEREQKELHSLFI